MSDLVIAIREAAWGGAMAAVGSCRGLGLWAMCVSHCKKTVSSGTCNLCKLVSAGLCH